MLNSCSITLTLTLSGDLKFKVINLYSNDILASYMAGVVLVFFNILFVMTVWSFVQAMITDPGQVPVFWVTNYITLRIIGFPLRRCEHEKATILFTV